MEVKHHELNNLLLEATEVEFEGLDWSSFKVMLFPQRVSQHLILSGSGDLQSDLSCDSLLLASCSGRVSVWVPWPLASGRVRPLVRR